MTSRILFCSFLIGIGVGIATDRAYVGETASYGLASAKEGESNLPADGIYPHGRKLALMG